MSTTELLQEARDAIVKLTNEADPVCEFCRGTTQHTGEGHRSGCIVRRLEAAIVGDGHE